MNVEYLYRYRGTETPLIALPRETILRVSQAVSNSLEEKEDPRMVDRPYQYKHIIATFFDCDANLLDKNHFLKTSLLAIEKANMTLVHVPNNPLVYKVDEDIMGGGVSVNALITTSHLTIHSAKDYSSVEFDCATCGPESRPEEAFKVFEKTLKPKKLKIWFKKGIVDCLTRKKINY